MFMYCRRESGGSDDATFVDWTDRAEADKEVRDHKKEAAITLRLQTPHAPDMLELSRVFARTLRVDEPQRHFPRWQADNDDASSIVSTATASV